MSDIDFDELDKAVASVLNNTPPAAPAQPAQPMTPVQTAPPVTAPEPVAVTVATPAPKPAAANASDLHPAAPPAPRGRFLDMVHPSGDMRGPVGAPVRPTVTPAAPVVPAAPAPVFATEPVVSAPVSAAPVTAPVTPTLAETPASAPVVAPVTQTPAAAPAAEVPPNDFFAASPDDSAPHDAPSVPPVASPFIPDAKVEKRPLGAFATDTPANGDVHTQLNAIESEESVVLESPVPAKADPAVANKPGHVLNPISQIEAPAFFKHTEPAAAPTELPKHGHGAWIWLTVAVAILLIGFGVGAALYFTVLN